MTSQANAILRGAAQRLAAEGNHQAALDLLAEAPASEGAALRARIYCQQGQFAKGAECWREVLAADTGNQEARQGLALAESLARSPLGRIRLHARTWMLALAAVLLAGAATAGVVAWRAESAAGANANRELAGSLERLQKRVEALDSVSRESADLERRIDGAETAAAGSQEQLKGQLQRMQQSLRRIEKALADLPAK